MPRVMFSRLPAQAVEIYSRYDGFSIISIFFTAIVMLLLNACGDANPVTFEPGFYTRSDWGIPWTQESGNERVFHNDMIFHNLQKVAVHADVAIRYNCPKEILYFGDGDARHKHTPEEIIDELKTQKSHNVISVFCYANTSSDEKKLGELEVFLKKLNYKRVLILQEHAEGVHLIKDEINKD